ncbi:MAG: DUF2029 domain-containing protein [Pirellulaceae bacterium]|nr:DUF2029 domain-containing protein [Pirellulaceae bacterium]
MNPSIKNEATAKFQIGHRWLAVTGLVLFLVGVAAGGARAVKKYQPPGPFTHDNAGFCDFHNGLYYPTAAVLKGISPYGREYADAYPVDRAIPFFSPGFLVLHAPIVMLPLRAAEILFFVLIVITALGIAYLTASMAGMPKRLDAILLIAGLLVFSRGGHSTFYNGYFTFEIILAALLAVHFADRRPWWSAFALVVVSAKPTYILPLGFLLLARRNFKALLIGAVLSILAAGIPFAWIAYQTGDGDLGAGFAQIADDIRATQEVHMQVPDEQPIHSWTRLDILAVAAKWLEVDPDQTIHLLVMFAVLAVPMVLLYRRAQLGIDDGAAGLTGLLILSAFLASLYHQFYDSLVLIAPLGGLMIGRVAGWKTVGLPTRIILAGLMLLPLFNYFSTRIFLRVVSPGDYALKVLTSVSGLAIFVVMIFACLLAFQQTRRMPTD